MKRVSAFAVFGKERASIEENQEKTKNVQRASSVPDITGKNERKKGKSILNVLKSNSFKQNVTPKIVRMTPKLKVCADSDVAGDNSVMLTSLRSVDKLPKGNNSSAERKQLSAKKSQLMESRDTPKLPPAVKRQRSDFTSKLPPKGKPPRASLPIKQKSITVPQNEMKIDCPPINGEDTSNEEPERKRPKIQQNLNSIDSNQPEMSNGDPYMFDSQQEATKIFQNLIHPVKIEKFMRELWEKKPLLLKRHIKDYNKGWFSSKELDEILCKNNIEFSVNLDITSYKNGERQTHNPIGRAYSATVWDFYQNGCSVRMLNPQTYSKNVWKLLSSLQEYFGCCVGANVYLTPPGTQGFAPHFDDIEAFIVQLEGEKHWKLYSPRSDAETLPRYSSGNFKDVDIGNPILETVLGPGDLLYFPRGTIHQAKTIGDEHSLHITVSCYQKNSWADLLETLVPRALDVAIEENVELRKGLPVDYRSYMGITNSDTDSQRRREFLKKVREHMMRVIDNMPIDPACDQMGKKFIHDSLPPAYTEAEKSCSIHGTKSRWNVGNKQAVIDEELEPDTLVKLIRKGVLHMLTEDDQVRIYYSTENARLYHQTDPRYVDIKPEIAPGVEYLLESYPEFVSIDSFPLETLDNKIELANILYEQGLLQTEHPLQEESDDD